MAEISGETAGIIAAAVTGLTVVGGGIKWLFAQRDVRQRMVDESVRQQYALLEARITATEERATRAEARAGLADDRATRAERTVGNLTLAFQMLAGELARQSPKSAVLAEAQRLFDIAFALPSHTPDVMADLMDTLHDRTKGPAE